jgi:hypothetical protein
VLVDQVLGKLARRPALDAALLSANRSGDQLVITKRSRCMTSWAPRAIGRTRWRRSLAGSGLPGRLFIGTYNVARW